ncbi:MAG: Smr/MutS family protein [Gammaproteobacteria bacterium]|nr:Smr/MutS family protein [Gammaproteobacteria bacterium]
MTKSSNISKADRDLFRRNIGSVNRIKHDRVVLNSQKPPPVPVQSRAEDQAVIQKLAMSPFAVEEVECGDELLFKRPGIQQQILRKLRRGQFAVEKVLDLHGMTVKEAKVALIRFLADCRTEGCRCVRIIHGKGHGSINRQPILKNKLNQWLQRQQDVLAFTSARLVDGGTGAVYVLIKRH